MQRNCCDCGRVIMACNGFVVAGDFVKAAEGKMNFKNVRERCAWCVERKSASVQ